MTWLIVIGLLLAGLTGTSGLAADPATAPHDWPQFLGPNRNGISRETQLLKRWPTDGPRELWRVSGGVGMSGVVVSQNRAITLVQRGGQQWAIALDATSGESLWQSALGPAYRNSMGDGPRATPAIAGDRVLVMTGEGHLIALSLADGKQLWSHNVVAEHGGEVPDYGAACSPLVIDQVVVVAVGAPRASVAAYDLQSGHPTWQAGNDPAGYSSPALLHVGGQSQLVVATGASILGLKPDSGSLLWRYPFETDYGCNIATPLAIDGQVFISAGENHGCALLALQPEGDRFKVSETWTSLGTKSVLRNEWQTSILHDGHLFGFDNVGAAGPVTHLACVDAKSGRPVWQQPRFGKGNLIAADGNLFISTISGELAIVRLTTTGFEELGRKSVLGPTRQAPALAQGRLYLRDDREIVCLDVRLE